MDRYQQEEKRSERPRFRGELMNRPSAGQTGARESRSREMAGRKIAGRGMAGREMAGRKIAGWEMAGRQTAAGSQRSHNPGTGGENSRPRFRGENQYTGNSVSYNREARARAIARQRRKRRQRQRMLAGAAILLLCLTGGAVLGILGWQDSRERKAFAEAGAAAAAAGNYEEAAAAFDKALKPGGRIGKFETDVLLNRAEAEYRQGSYDKALETYRLLLEDDRDSDMAKRGAALCLMEQGSYEEALALEVLQAQVYNRMAADQIEAGQYEEALASINLGRGFSDSLAAQDLSFNEAVAYERMGDYGRAKELFEAYTAQYGEDERARRELAFLQTRQGKYGQ